MGVDVDNIGCHSVRKGSVTRCSTGCTVSPSMASICLYVGWGMGPVRERYIHYKKARDKFEKRTVCGFNYMSTEFGVSPCSFDCTGINEDDRQSTQDSIDETIKQLIVGGMGLATKAYIITKCFYAALCYQHKFLDNAICSSNRLRQSPLFHYCS